MAADLEGETAEDSELGARRRRKAQNLSLGDAAAPSGGPAKRMKKRRKPELQPKFASSWTPAGDLTYSGKPT